MKNIIYYLQYIILRLAAFPISRLPPAILWGCACCLGQTAYFLGLRRRVTLENIRQALGKETSATIIEETARHCYTNIAMTFLEIPRIYRLKKKFLKMVDLEGIEILNMIAERGRGMILISAHFSNWEITGATNAAVSKIPITTVATRQSNPYVDSYINRVRHELGLKIVPLADSAKALVAALKKKEAIGLISDQNAGPNGVFVDFFGRPASTPKGGAQLALKFKTPVVVTLSVRTSPGRHKCIFKEVKVMEDDTVESLTQRYTSVMEEIIRQYPQHYFWMHRRWKTRPKDNGQ